MEAAAVGQGSVAEATGSGVKQDYLIGPGDTLSIFVWRHPEMSIRVPVRPDGRISAPLVEDVDAEGKTPTQLARDIEEVLSVYVKQPKVTIIVEGFGVGYGQQVRVVGQATTPGALRYQEGMTLLDAIIAVGGINEFAAGNRAVVVRTAKGNMERIPVRLDDLLDEGDMEANIPLMPGDVVVIPQSWF